jgi:hypothetical protein
MGQNMPMPKPTVNGLGRLAAVLAVTALTSLPVAAGAASPPGVPALVKAVASPWMPTIDRVQVQALEASDVDDQLVAAITAALAKRGITVDPAATLILYYDTEINSDTADTAAGSEPTVDQTELGAPGASRELFTPLDVGTLYGEYTPGQMPEVISVDVGSGGTSVSEGLATPAGVIPERTAGGGGQARLAARGQPYSLYFTLGRDGGSPVWSGSIQANMPEQDPAAVGRAMVPPLVLAIGRSGKSTIIIPSPGLTN